MLPLYQYAAAPAGHPRPWWYQAMAYLWWRIGWEMMHPSKSVSVDLPECQGEYATGGAYRRVEMCPYHPWMPADKCYLK